MQPGPARVVRRRPGGPHRPPRRGGPRRVTAARARAHVVTRSIDGPHRAVGSPADRVHEPHGTLTRARCMRRRRPAPMDDTLRAVRAGAAEPAGPACATGVLRPDMVPFGDPPTAACTGGPPTRCGRRTFLSVVGTSPRVEPAAAVCATAVDRGAASAIVDTEAAPYDDFASDVPRGDVELVVPRVVAAPEAGGPPVG
ncbi:Sir2 family NAD-dependent protein deacetylase [Embleya sp. NPDC020886]|uniref:Sir2 family NAD-dependent protein deacetylase n=1 Tax=Embleya sp. NPDC020886 TaxID=3363980 RepID=UPI0037BBAAAE